MVRIITDSAADFEPVELERMNIACIPLSVLIGGKEYRENLDITKNQYYELLAQTKEFPKTSQPAPHLLKELFEDAAANGDEAIFITLSSGLSGTYQSSVMIKNDLGFENCYVVDSLNGTGGERMVVEYAVRLRDEGKGAAEIVEKIEALRSRVVLYACMDTLEYLYRGGRISHTAYTLGSLTQIKPILHVDPEGRAEIPAKMMGMRKGMDFMCKKIQTVKPDPEFPVYIMYTYNRKNGEVLAQRVRDMGYDVPDERIINVGAVVGSHIGPQACGIVYIGEK